MLNLIEIILHRTSHPGNIGATARAMKNMCLGHLCLAEPLHFPDPQATDRASGADDILENARVVASIDDALAPQQWVFATSARSREFAWPQLTPKQAAQKIIAAAQNQQKVAVLFGNEQSGLSNEDLQRCDYHIAIPTNPAFASLNVASAVQVISYEIYQAFLSEETFEQLEEKASQKEVQGLLDHLLQVAIDREFLDPKHPKKLLPRLRKLLTKSSLTSEEVNILRGFLKAVQTHRRELSLTN